MYRSSGCSNWCSFPLKPCLGVSSPAYPWVSCLQRHPPPTRIAAAVRTQTRSAVVELLLRPREALALRTSLSGARKPRELRAVRFLLCPSAVLATYAFLSKGCESSLCFSVMDRQLSDLKRSLLSPSNASQHVEGLAESQSL